MALGNTFEMGATNYTAFYHYTGTKFFNGQVEEGFGTAFGECTGTIIRYNILA